VSTQWFEVKMVVMSSGRRRRSPKETSEAILRATEAALGAPSGGSFKMSEIAKMANISRSTINHYFGSKDALIAEICRRRDGKIGR
jgi:AcrR family transcriptional regulator